MKIIDKENLMNDFLMGNIPQDKNIKEISIDKLNSFHTGEYEHVFSVNEDEDMLSLIEDIRVNDVVEPILVRPDVDDEYEIIAGHRRVYASRKIGKDAIKAIILDYDDDLAIKTMILTNLEKRSIIKPSEKAFAYKAYMDENKRQGYRNDLSKKKFKNASKELEEKYFENERTIRRYIRLTRLTPELLNLVDNKEIDFTSAVNLTFLDKEMQAGTYNTIKSGEKINANVSKELKNRFNEGSLRDIHTIKEVFNTQSKKLDISKINIELNKLLPDDIKELSIEEKCNFVKEAIEGYEEFIKETERKIEIWLKKQ